MGSKSSLPLVETSCYRIEVIHKCSVILHVKTLFTIYYSSILTNEVFVGEDQVRASNASQGMAWGSQRSCETLMRPCARTGNKYHGR